MKVIIGIDNLASVTKITEFVLKHKWDETVEFRLIFAVAPLMMDHPMASYPLFLENAVRETEEAGRKLLQEAAEKLRSGLQACVETQIATGLPVQVLVAAAREWQADLIVTGTHGRQGLDRFFFGSVAYDVAAHAPCSVLALRLESDFVEAEEAAKAVAAQR